MDINLIGVPMFFGSDTNGTDLGPEKLREKGITELIRKNGHNLYDCGNLYVENLTEDKKFQFHHRMKYLNPIIEVNRNLAHQVYSALSVNCFPLVIGGDHSLGLGSISGASKYFRNLSVVWIDAHGDINTEETSPSGNIHGMPLAAAMGLGYSELVNLYHVGVKINPENVFIIGARDLDKGEKELIKSLNLNVYSSQDIHTHGIDIIMEKVQAKLNENNTKAIHLSFDIDCIDSNLVPGTGTPVREGLTVDETKHILKHLMQTNLVKSMDFVELNPWLDENDRTADICMELLDWAFNEQITLPKIELTHI